MSGPYIHDAKCTGHPGPPCPAHHPEGYASRGWRRQNRNWREQMAAAGKRETPIATRVTWPDAELLARARRHKPIEIPAEAARSGDGGWKDVSVDVWGARRKGLARQWSNGQCLQASIASLLGADVAEVPNPEISYAARDDWHSHYNERLAKAIGHRLEFLPAHACPPRKATQLWIAGIHEHGDRDGHAVVARGAFVVHDPAGIYQGSLPMDRITDGMILAPTRRAVKVLSPLGSGYTVVSA
jgi:hypothetical protein